MYSQPQEESDGPSGAADAPDELEPDATAASEGAPDVQGAAAPGRRPAHVSALLAEIARAMQAAAAQERERIHAGVAEDEAVQVEKVRARAIAEAAALRQGADDDERQVESWCEEQIRQIRIEADRRITTRRIELEQSVTQHGALIESEVQSVHGAVQGYRSSLDAFFARMAEEDDPSAIAGLAGTLPDPPDLDAVRADARSRAMRELEAEESAAAPPPSNDDGPTDAPDALSSSAEPVAVMAPDDAAEPVPVMEPEAAGDPDATVEPVPVMDPAVEESSHQSVAARVIRSLASRTPPPHAQQ